MTLHLYLGFYAKGVSRSAVQLGLLGFVLSRSRRIAGLFDVMLHAERVGCRRVVQFGLLRFVVPWRGRVVSHQLLPFRSKRVGRCVVQFHLLRLVCTGRYKSMDNHHYY